MTYALIYLLLFGANMLIAFVIYVWMPDYRVYFITEDSLIENLSAFFFLSTFFLGFILSVKNKKNRKLLRIVAAVGLLCFLDEVSFGERLFDLNMSQIYGTKLDAVHDFIKLGYKVIRDHAHSYAGVVYPLLAFCAIVGIIGVLKYRTELIAIISIASSNQTYVLALFFVSLVLGAIIFDLDILHIRGALVLEELFEMNAGLALLFCCLSLHKDK